MAQEEPRTTDFDGSVAIGDEPRWLRALQVAHEANSLDPGWSKIAIDNLVQLAELISILQRHGNAVRRRNELIKFGITFCENAPLLSAALRTVRLAETTGELKPGTFHSLAGLWLELAATGR